MADRMKCECCDYELHVQWSDTHGIGACLTCGLPYRILHYEDDKRVDKPPSVALSPVGVEIAKRYWREEHRRVFPAAYDMGVGRSGRSYSGASAEDCEKFGAWYKAHEAEFPAEAQAA